jgi:quinol monooxygenase YgiN
MPMKSNLYPSRWSFLQMSVALTLAVLGLVGLARAQQSASTSRIYVISHIDLLGPQVAAGTKLLQQYAVDSRKDKGFVRIEVMDQISRLNHFSVVEVWDSQADFDAHVAAEHTVQFRHQIDPLLGSPYDERPHKIVE